MHEMHSLTQEQATLAPGAENLNFISRLQTVRASSLQRVSPQDSELRPKNTKLERLTDTGQERFFARWLLSSVCSLRAPMTPLNLELLGMYIHTCFGLNICILGCFAQN